MQVAEGVLTRTPCRKNRADPTGRRKIGFRHDLQSYKDNLSRDRYPRRFGVVEEYQPEGLLYGYPNLKVGQNISVLVKLVSFVTEGPCLPKNTDP